MLPSTNRRGPATSGVTVEAVLQPVLAIATDTVSTLSHDVAAAFAPVEAVLQPVLAITVVAAKS